MADHSSLQRWIDMGLFDPDAPDAESLQQVLAIYDSIGLDPAEFEGVEPAHLMSAMNMRILRPGRRFTAAEACSASGLDDASSNGCAGRLAMRSTAASPKWT